jgi:outer membrane protein assembly factor BamD
MANRVPVIVLLGLLVLSVGCTNKKVNNPLANVASKQPDKVLFDRAMDAMKHNKFDVARITLQTLINTYPDSEYIARAKLAVADSWYAEGGSASLAQAEAEYKDFETFFPNMPEAAEAQLKIANIHYQEMEKPDRDYTHAMRAEDEYRQLIQQYPDSKLVPQAKQRLLEVQEVLAEREFEVARFYYTRQIYPASIARLRSLMDRYPLYSKADEALYLLGQSYEAEIAMIRARPGTEAQKSGVLQELTKGATDAYDKIITRYPVMDRVDDAKLRLQALHQPIPRPTKEAIAQNQAEENSRHTTSTFGRLREGFEKHPDVARAATVGEPPMVDPPMVSASDVVQEATDAMRGVSSVGNNTLSVETVGVGAPPPNQQAPRSDAAQTPDPNELKPNVQPDPNELKPNVSDDAAHAPPPLQQINEIQPGSAAASAQPADPKSADAATSSSSHEDDSTVASSKHKKKKGLKKIIPF